MSSGKKATRRGGEPSNGGAERRRESGRCRIYAEIDELAACCAMADGKRFPELVARLQKILRHLAYYAETSEGAVLEDREKWHDRYTDRLYEEAGAPRRDAAEAAPPPSGGALFPRAGGAAATAHRAPPVPVRSSASSLPASLRSLYEGEIPVSDDDD